MKETKPTYKKQGNITLTNLVYNMCRYEQVMRLGMN